MLNGLQITEESATILPDYATVPAAFTVHSVLDVMGDDTGSYRLSERRLDSPYTKDYDALDGSSPQQWAEHFDLKHWRFLIARIDGRIAGGAAVALNAPELRALEKRSDSAILWDIRVMPDMRGLGIGSALFRSAEELAQAHGCRHFTIETQNINVSACRFYERQGCMLAAVHPGAYPTLPEEIQLLWYKKIPERIDR